MTDLGVKFFVDHLSKPSSIYVVTVYSLLGQGVNPKSTLLELLQGIRFVAQDIASVYTFTIYSTRQRVDKTTAARKECARGTRAISRRRTSASSRILGSGIEADWTPRVKRRETEVNVGTLDELFTLSRTRQEDEAEFSQKPSVSSFVYRYREH